MGNSQLKVIRIAWPFSFVSPFPLLHSLNSLALQRPMIRLSGEDETHSHLCHHLPPCDRTLLTYQPERSYEQKGPPKAPNEHIGILYPAREIPDPLNPCNGRCLGRKCRPGSQSPPQNASRRSHLLRLFSFAGSPDSRLHFSSLPPDPK